MRSLRWVCSVVLLSLSVSPVFCQSPTGVLPFESFSGDQFESVNVANLNLHVAIPFVKRAGRGIPFFYGLVYDSQIWAPTSGHWTGAPNLAFLGWRGATSGNFNINNPAATVTDISPTHVRTAQTVDFVVTGSGYISGVKRGGPDIRSILSSGRRSTSAPLHRSEPTRTQRSTLRRQKGARRVDRRQQAGRGELR